MWNRVYNLGIDGGNSLCEWLAKGNMDKTFPLAYIRKLGEG